MQRARARPRVSCPGAVSTPQSGPCAYQHSARRHERSCSRPGPSPGLLSPLTLAASACMCPSTAIKHASPFGPILAMPPATWSSRCPPTYLRCLVVPVGVIGVCIRIHRRVRGILPQAHKGRSTFADISMLRQRAVLPVHAHVTCSASPATCPAACPCFLFANVYSVCARAASAAFAIRARTRRSWTHPVVVVARCGVLDRA